jgi:hypothetical protein
MGFKSLTQLANAVLEIHKSDSIELREFCEHKNLDFPKIEEDTIPETLLNSYLRFLVAQGINQVIVGPTKHAILESGNENVKIDNSEKGIFDAISKLQHCFLVKEEKTKLTLVLPNHDCPYTLILGTRKQVSLLVTNFKIEGFWVDEKTRFDWWSI